MKTAEDDCLKRMLAYIAFTNLETAREPTALV